MLPVRRSTAALPGELECESESIAESPSMDLVMICRSGNFACSLMGTFPTLQAVMIKFAGVRPRPGLPPALRIHRRGGQRRTDPHDLESSATATTTATCLIRSFGPFINRCRLPAPLTTVRARGVGHAPVDVQLALKTVSRCHSRNCRFGRSVRCSGTAKGCPTRV